VAAGLTRRGATCIDVDQLSRSLQQPGRPVFLQMVDRWGDRVLNDDGTLDRAAVGAITFGDRDETAALMAITSRAIEEAQEAAITPLEDTEAVVLLESALLGARMHGTQGLLVVDAPEEVAVARLVEQRGMTADEVRARTAHQRPRADRPAQADFVIDNSDDDPGSLESRLDAAMDWMGSLPDARYGPNLFAERHT
jgi:dephospho-CoA kinase